MYEIIAAQANAQTKATDSYIKRYAKCDELR